MMQNGCVSRLSALCLAVVILVSLCSCNIYDLLGQQTGQPEPSSTDAVTDTEETLPEEEELPEEPDEYALTLERLIAQLNEQRAASSSDAAVPENYLPDYTSAEFLGSEFSKAELERLTTYPGYISGKITCQQAMEDVRTFFRIMRTSYGAYVLYGGDEVFGAAEEKLLGRLESGFPDGIEPNVLRVMLTEAVKFIDDSHFAIGGGGTGFAEQRFFKDKTKLIFREDELGYYTTFKDDVSEERWYLAEEDEQWLRMTIADDGELCWGLFLVTDNYYVSSMPQSFTLTTHHGVTRVHEPKWQIMECEYTVDNDCYEFYEVDGIPVVSLTTYFLEQSNFDEINQYLNDAKTLRDEEVIVVDLRYNTGGYDSLSAMWLYSLTSGTDIDWGIGYASYISALNEYILSSNEEAVNDLFESLDFFDDYPEYWGEEEEEEEYYQGGTYIVEPESDIYEYDGTIFVLFNKHTYSAGELALFQFENMSNVVFVGMNSNGCLLTGGTNANAPVWLPNSGISVSYSMMLVISDIMEGFDSYGFMPDIVVDNGTAVDSVIKCWNYYNQE